MERSKSDERQHFPISRCILLLSSIFAVRSFIASMLCLLLRSIVSSIAPFSSSFATLWTIVAVGVADAVSFVRLFFPQIYIFSIFYRFPLSAHICVRQQHSMALHIAEHILFLSPSAGHLCCFTMPNRFHRNDSK